MAKRNLSPRVKRSRPSPYPPVGGSGVSRSASFYERVFISSSLLLFPLSSPFSSLSRVLLLLSSLAPSSKRALAARRRSGLSSPDPDLGGRDMGPERLRRERLGPRAPPPPGGRGSCAAAAGGVRAPRAAAARRDGPDPARRRRRKGGAQAPCAAAARGRGQGPPRRRRVGGVVRRRWIPAPPWTLTVLRSRGSMRWPELTMEKMDHDAQAGAPGGRVPYAQPRRRRWRRAAETEAPRGTPAGLLSLPSSASVETPAETTIVFHVIF
ncbi:hypothetical protein PVAP13_8KG127401 [Panicum virgatum]|uniref:Uncharacterized protein n=1 Tax=Panicum virgatum TaxID=38727 RepID=A0A8T0PIC7_PANVG|nr:hypothetical protein PVAP13_8KG127401 [Panicum virgatum]